MKCSTVVMALVPVLGALLGELNRLGRQTRFDHLPEDLQPFRPYTIQTLNGLGIVRDKYTHFYPSPRLVKV